MIVLAPDFMTKICKKASQHFHWTVSKVFHRVKPVALWSANIGKLAKDHKGYGSAARSSPDTRLYRNKKFIYTQCGIFIDIVSSVCGSSKHNYMILFNCVGFSLIKLCIRICLWHILIEYFT